MRNCRTYCAVVCFLFFGMAAQADNLPITRTTAPGSKTISLYSIVNKGVML